MRGSIRKVLGLGLLGIMLATPAIVMAQGHGKKGGAGHGGGKAGKKGPTKGGRGGN
jgi:hypothetical protein